MKTAIFDLDGTIADTLYDLADAVNYGLRKLGLPEQSYENIKMFVGNGVQKLCFRALPSDKKNETDNLLSIFTDYYDEHFIDKTRLYPGIYDVISLLSSNNVKIAVATNKPQVFAEKIINQLLPDFTFESILGGCAEREKKPCPQIIFDIVKNLPKNNAAFMIGDSSVDIATAKNANITSIGCIWGFRPRNELENAGADFIAERPSDIAKFILR